MGAFVSHPKGYVKRLDEKLIRDTILAGAKDPVARNDVGRESLKWQFMEGGVGTIKTLPNQKFAHPLRSEFDAVKTV
jgi:hypothetical protein